MIQYKLKINFLALFQILFSLSILNFTSEVAFAKKIVCSITLNSRDEIDSFRNFLPSEDFKFVELITSDRNWLENACREGIQCDVVVMSGHFGGSFFGVKGFLPLEEMEAASCNSQCNGIFHNATEVYMYGCNTLAGKNKDHRTPQEYMRVLREDGYSRFEAQRIAAFLYSPFGAAFYSRMSKVFSKTPRIYGFDGKAPLGPAIKPILSNYLRTMAPNFYNYLNDQTTEDNKIYSSALSKTNSTQIAGNFTNEVFPACYINGSEHSNTEKLAWIKDRITNESLKNKFDTIPMAQYFFSSLKKSGYILTDEDTRIINELSNNLQVQASIARLRKQLNAMPNIKYQLAEFEHSMKWISDSSFKEVEIDAIIGDDRTTYSIEQKNYVCSLNHFVDLRLEDIPVSFLTQGSFLWALACLKPTDERLIKIMSNYLVNGTQNGALIEIANLISKAHPKDPEISTNLYKALLKQNSFTVQWFMIFALGSIPTSDQGIIEELASLLQNTRNLNLGEVLASALGRIMPKNPNTQMKIVFALENFLRSPQEYTGESFDSDYLPNSISYALNRIRPTDAKVRSAIVNIQTTYAISQKTKLNLDLALNGTRNSN